MATFDLLKTGSKKLDSIIEEHIEQVKSHARLNLLDSYVGERVYYHYVMFEMGKPHRSGIEIYEKALNYTITHLAKVKK